MEATWCQTRFLSTNSGNYSMFTGQVMKALTLFKQSGLHDKYEHLDKWIKLYTTLIGESIITWDDKNSQNLPWKKKRNMTNYKCNTPFPEYVLSCVFRFSDRIFSICFLYLFCFMNSLYDCFVLDLDSWTRSQSQSEPGTRL